MGENIFYNKYVECIKTHENYMKTLKTIGIEVNEEYRGIRVKIKHTCKNCGRTDWFVEPYKVLNGETECKECKIRPEIDKVCYMDFLSKIGMRICEEFIDINTPILHKCIECLREDWLITPYDVIVNKVRRCYKCNNSKDKKIHYVSMAYDTGVRPLERYINSTTKIRHECSFCSRHDWDVMPGNVLSGVKICRASLTESIMASTLKQVLRHEYPDTIFEYDAGFRGPNGGTGKYDIYIPHINTLIECQSEYHDEPEQVAIDIMKAKYAIENEYKFIDLDSRDYTPLQAIQKFIPSIQVIPSYVKIEKNIDYDKICKAQQMLNSKKKYDEIASTLNVGYGWIQYKIKTGLLEKPLDLRPGRKKSKSNIRKDRINNTEHSIKEPNKENNQIARILRLGDTLKCTNTAIAGVVIIQLNTSRRIVGKYTVNKTDEIQEIPKELKLSIIGACISKTHRYRGYYWYFEQDYINKNNNIQDE